MTGTHETQPASAREVGLVLSLLTAPQVDRLALAAAAAVAGFAYVVIMSRLRRVAVVVWLAVLCLVPVWIGADVVYFWQAIVVMTALTVLTLILADPHLRLALHPADVVFVGILLVSTAALALNLSNIAAVFDLTTTWLLPYALGRLLSQLVDQSWLYSAIAVAFTLIAALALVEFFFAFNPFTLLTPSNYLANLWAPLQPRGGFLRAEGAFGHSIALGCSIALALPLTLASGLRFRWKVAMAVVLAAAAVATLSRVGMICTALGMILMALRSDALTERRHRVTLLTVTGGSIAIGLAASWGVFLAAGREASESSDYRFDLLRMFGAMAPLGLSPDYSRSSTGTVTFGEFRSVDNAVLLTGLTYGWLPLLALMIALALAVWRMLRRRCGAAIIAVCAQIPALFSVALITQYTDFLWFVIGLSVSTTAGLLRSTSDPAAPLAVPADVRSETLGASR